MNHKKMKTDLTVIILNSFYPLKYMKDSCTHDIASPLRLGKMAMILLMLSKVLYSRIPSEKGSSSFCVRDNLR